MIMRPAGIVAAALLGASLALAAPPAQPGRATPGGRMPFGPGEVARYQIAWQAAYAGLSAGVVEFSVRDDRSEPGARLRLDMTLETAQWISRFFEARDRFWTVVGADLLPRIHRQEISEGRRQEVRTARYDAKARLVRAGAGRLESVSDGATFPLDPAARDPLSAFYYVRTLDLKPGASVRVPINDLGRPQAAVVQAGSIGTAEAEGRVQAAQFLDVRLERAAGGEPATRLGAWVTTDARRVPLVLEIETTVGAFRAVLVSFRGAAPGPPARGR